METSLPIRRTLFQVSYFQLTFKIIYWQFMMLLQYFEFEQTPGDGER